MATFEHQVAPHPLPCAETSAAPVRVVPLQESRETEWDRFVLAHPKGSFFHQLGWKRVMEKTYGYEPRYLCATRGERITGIAPAILVSSWITGRTLTVAEL